uniref:Uncharacterized protein n=1 Tax=Aegilops tauschii TaxID=37682 RepID=M8C631_AEGTA
MAPQELHDDDKHKEAPTSTCTPPSSNGNPSGAVHPTTSSPPSDASGHRPAAANSFPLVLKFEEVVYKVKVGQATEGWCTRVVSSACGGGAVTKKNKAAALPPREKTIISGMSGVVRPGEMLAMLGPSGSGKTTLLTALGGRHRHALLSGKITYNGQPFSGAVKRRTGFVTQHDVLYPHLTVSETLWYTALLRLPRALSAGEKRVQAEAVARELGLSKVAHSMVGGVRGVRGLSGGERKRVLLLSAEGRPIYYGRAADALSYFASVGFASPLSVNPADLMLDLANGILPETNGDGVPGGGSEGEQKEVRAKLADAGPAPAALGRRSVLLRRGLKERRHESFNKLRIFQVLSVAFLAGLLWWRTPAAHLQDRTALIFFFSVFWGFFPLYNAVFVFPLERPMLLKERSSGMYRLSSYFAARTAADLPMELGLPTAFVLILYWMGGLDPRPASFLLSLLVVLYSVLVAQSLGLAVGAVLMDVKQGTTLASVVTMVFLIAWLNYSFYCYRLLLGIQFRDGGALYDCGGGALCPVADFPAIKAVGLNNHWVDVCVMALLLVGYRVVAYLALDRLQPR